ncbi:MAG: phosphatidylserine decarboxylase [Campylobacterales bacterium]|nr:phosphatidylserine decarboxylase [Campylobacterales bacterium]
MNKTHTTTQIVAKEGWKSIGVAFVLFVLSLIFGVIPWVFLTLLAALIFLHRNPERIPEEDDRLVIIAPADGMVRSIEKGKTPAGEACLRVVIENSLLDVGVLRAPCALVISHAHPRHGLFLPQPSPKAPLLNEQILLTCKRENETVYMRVMAGVFTQSIRLFAEKPTVKLGERLGYIHEGAVELLLPLHVRIRVTLGQSLKAGETVLGYFKSEQ